MGGLLGAAIASFVACSAANSPTPTGSSSGTGSGGAGGGFITTGPGTGGGSNNGCGSGAELVYVLSTDNDLYSFKPDQKVFTKIGPLQCNTAMLPNSMAVDRDAFAWVNYVEGDGLGDTAGTVFKVNTNDGSCQPTNIQLPFGWYRLGMGFSADQAGQAAETLYVTGTAQGASPGIGRIDFGSGQVVPIGSFTGALNGQNAELTGTGDARLFGFFTTTPVNVAEINKASGAILSQKQLPTVETPFAWAFSFWGGDFYLYTAPDELSQPNRTSNVTRYRPSDGTVDTAYMLNVGFRIVGAGVSTCAPIAPPK